MDTPLWRTLVLMFIFKGSLGRLPELRNMTDLGMLFLFGEYILSEVQKSTKHEQN